MFLLQKYSSLLAGKLLTFKNCKVSCSSGTSSLSSNNLLFLASFLTVANLGLDTVGSRFLASRLPELCPASLPQNELAKRSKIPGYSTWFSRNLLSLIKIT
jgi:hypothetical protein